MLRNTFIDSIEEQVIIGFTGKLNILKSSTKQMLGYVLFYEGRVVNAFYKGFDGIKAFYSLAIESSITADMTMLIEPEIVEMDQLKIHYPMAVLRMKVEKKLEKYDEMKDQKPPSDLRVELRSDFICNSGTLIEEEFEIMKTLVDFHTIEDVYENSKLLDFEITNALVSLRKKNALKIIQTKG